MEYDEAGNMQIHVGDFTIKLVRQDDDGNPIATNGKAVAVQDDGVDMDGSKLHPGWLGVWKTNHGELTIKPCSKVYGKRDRRGPFQDIKGFFSDTGAGSVEGGILRGGHERSRVEGTYRNKGDAGSFGLAFKDRNRKTFEGQLKSAVSNKRDSWNGVKVRNLRPEELVVVA